MIKLTFLREEDYWLFPLSIIAIISTVVMVYASAFSFRAPAAVVSIGLLWFTTTKVREGYSAKRAKLHFGLCILISTLLFALVYGLTN